MTLVYMAMGVGRGKCMRAAAVLRRVKRPVVVIVTNRQIPDALDWAGITYIVSKNPSQTLAQLEPEALVLDGPTGKTPKLPTIRIGRIDRAGDFSAEQPLPYSLDGEVLSRQEAAELVGGTGMIYVPSRFTETPPGALVAPDAPACRWLAAADHVVGFAGCNLYWQVTGCGVDATWLASPEPDQRLRVPAGFAKGSGYRPPPQDGINDIAARIEAL